MKKILIFSILLSLSFSGLAQSPKREFRATWLTTVWRNDWPKSTIITSTGNSGEIQMQKNEMIAILDSLKRLNANSVCFQVRSRCDAMYKSSYEPWSSDLVGTRGMDPGYDPLAFVVQEGHKRGIEVHTWINPYRFESVTNQWSGLPGDYRSTHPDWLLTYPATNNSILNPGHPEVLLQIKKIVAEIVKNYDIDGVIF
ncbi:MAG TPA: family 10 glycosylhydrolase, partial [Paludibacteraceae bacterium]|nr:family 10 glycosylhydrolase [Paludibacteraceae bacterium]